MSGRDFKRFLSCHQYQLGQQDSRMVHKYLNGGPNEMKEKMNYEQMKMVIQLKRSAAAESLSKVKKINHVSKAGKEENILQQHRNAWLSYYKRINQQVKSTSQQFLKLLNSRAVLDEEISEFYDRSQELEADTEIQQEQFNKQTVEPIYDLCEDLKLWIKNHCSSSSQANEADPSDIQGIIDSVKNQQHKVYGILVSEEEELTTSLEIDMSSFGLEKADFKLPSVSTGVPLDIIEYQCHDSELKCKVMEEFWNLDDSFVMQLTLLEEKYIFIRQREPFNGWFGEDHIRFLQISEQYPLHMTNRSKLFFDRVLREFPSLNRDDVVAHDDWCRLRTLFYTQLKETINSWQRCRDETLSSSLVILRKSNDAWQCKEKEKNVRHKQKLICEALHNELSVMQKKRQKSSEREMEIRKRNNEEEARQLKSQMQKEKARRQAAVEKLNQYHAEKAKQAVLQQEQERSRQEAFLVVQEKNKMEDIERINFRRSKFHEKLTQKEQMKQAMLEKEKEKEARLEKLRQKVRVIAPANPERISQHTMASDAHRAAIYETEKDLQQPLFYIHSFSDNQVVNDKRLKIEEALRDAGVIQSDYARKILARVNPPTIPRKNLTSNIFNPSDIT